MTRSTPIPPSEPQGETNMTKSEAKARIKQLLEVLGNFKDEVECLKNDAEYTQDEIEPYEGRSELTEAQQERLDWFEELTNTLQDLFDSVEEYQGTLEEMAE